MLLDHIIYWDTRAMKHITVSTLSLLSEEHTSRWNYQPHVKHTSGLSLSAYPFLQWPVTRIEILAYFPIAAAKASDVMMLSTWKEAYLLSIISFTFILSFNLKCACCPGQIPFKIFPAWNGLVYLTAPTLEFWRGKEAPSLFPCFLSPLFLPSGRLLK